MSDCIRINGVEHLPIERTLLIHYSILCSGLWDLNQSSTAYRNVCDSEWTVMYPNFQHPRHSDFPINLPTPGFQGTFAWNYDGIFGVAPESFDEGHSYLVQLSIFNFSCLHTGEVTGQPGTGSSGQIPTQPPDTSIPLYTLVPPVGPSPPPPRPPDPPVPGNPRPRPAQPNDPVFLPPPNPQPSGPTVVPPGRPRPTDDQTPSDPVPPNLPSDPGEPDPPRPGRPRNLDAILISSDPQSPVRPVDYQPGTIAPSRFIYTIETLDPSIVAPPSIPNAVQEGTYRPNIDLFNEGNTSVVFGQNSIASPPPYRSNETQINVSQINASNILSSSLTTLNTNVNDATIGSAVIVAGSFVPPTDMQISATANLYVMDSAGITNLIASSSNTSITSANPLQIGMSVSTSNMALGQATFILTVTQEDLVIGVATKAVGIRNIQSTFSSSNTSVPSALSTVGVNPILEDPIILNFSGPMTLIIENTSVDNRFTTFYTAPNNEERFNLTVTNLSNSQTVATTSTQGILNGIEYSPETHNVGLIDTSVSNSSFGLTINPITNSSQINGQLFLSQGFTLRQWEVNSISASSITLQTPYSERQLKLLTHGFRQSYIPSTYTLVSSTTNADGVITFNGLSLVAGYWYSVIDEGSNNYNVNTNIVYTNRYD